MSTKRKITTLVPVFGGNRTNAELPGQLLAGCRFVAVPFAGGMPEVAHLDAPTILVNDRHAHIINCARSVADPLLGPAMIRMLRRLAFHPMVLRGAQEACRVREKVDALPAADFSLAWAADYFVCAWMARNGTAGTDGEFTAGLSVRWDAGGGDSAVRFRNATEALRDWRRVLARCTFTSMDAFEFLGKCKDEEGHGYYLDPPWPRDGLDYKHKFTEADQRRLAVKLATYRQARVVVRYGAHPLIRELYPEPHWTWRRVTGRTQTNAAKAEVLLTNWAD